MRSQNFEKKSRETLLFVSSLIILIVLVALGYIFQIEWTGFLSNQLPYRTAWDWLDLLVAPLVLALIGYRLNVLQKRADNRREEAQRRKETSDQRDREEKRELEKEYEELRKKRLEEQENKRYRRALISDFWSYGKDLFTKEGENIFTEGSIPRGLIRTKIAYLLSELEHEEVGRFLESSRETRMGNTQDIDARRGIFKKYSFDDNTVLKQVRIENMDFDEIVFRKGSIHKTNLSGSSAVGSDFWGTIFTCSELSKVNFDTSRLNDCQFINTNLHLVKCRNSEFLSINGTAMIKGLRDQERFEIAGVDFSNSRISAVFQNLQFIDTDNVAPNFERTEFGGQNFPSGHRGSRFINVDFGNANCTGAVFTYTVFLNCDLSAAIFDLALFKGIEEIDEQSVNSMARKWQIVVQLVQRTLNTQEIIALKNQAEKESVTLFLDEEDELLLEASPIAIASQLPTQTGQISNELSGLNLSFVNLSETDLRYINFSRTDFSDSIFQKANLEGARFTDAILDNCDFTGSNISFAQINQAASINNIKLPTELNAYWDAENDNNGV